MNIKIGALVSALSATLALSAFFFSNETRLHEKKGVKQIVVGGSSRRRRNNNTTDKPPISNRWKHKFGNNSDGYLFFKHIRKASGTSIRQYLVDTMQYHHNQNNQATDGRVAYYEHEANAIDSRCPDVDRDRLYNSLSVISLRHPVERHLSEFFYSGPGSKNPLKKLHVRKKYSSPEYASLLRQELPLWIENGMNETHRTGKLFSHFSDDFQSRSLSGNSNKRPRQYEGAPNYNCTQYYQGQTISMNSSTFHPHKQTCRKKCKRGCDGPCSYGLALSKKGFIGDADQARAVANLKSFDVVLITETFEEEEQAAMLADAMGVPLEIASQFHSRANMRIRRNSTSEKLCGYQNILHKAGVPELIDLISNYSKYELELYKQAVQINRDMTEQWRNEKQAES